MHFHKLFKVPLYNQPTPLGIAAFHSRGKRNSLLLDETTKGVISGVMSNVRVERTILWGHGHTWSPSHVFQN